MSLLVDSIVERCKEDPEYKQEILDFLVRMEGAIQEVRQMVGE